jgi:DNA replication protein DnaC
MNNTADLTVHLQKLRLSRVNEVLDHHVQKAADQNLTHLEFLRRLLGDVVMFKEEQAIQGRIKQSRFPFVRRLEDFEYAFQPSVPAAKVRELATLRFVEAHDNLVFLGPPGTGKSHLSVGFGVAACEAGYKVRFTTTEDLLDQLHLAPGQPVSAAKLVPFLTPDILIIDDFGMQPFTATESHAFFTIVSRRYEKGSMILNSNKPLLDWGKILGGDDVLATAILDRLLHHAHIFNINGNTYRLKDKRHIFLPEAKTRDKNRSDPAGNL